MLALNDTEALRFAAGVLTLVSALFAVVAAFVGSSWLRRKRLSFAAFRPSFSAQNEVHSQALLLALENTGSDVLTETDLKEVVLVFPERAKESRIEDCRVRHNPNAVSVLEIAPVENGLKLSLGGMNKKELLVLELSVSNYRGTPPVVQTWIKGGTVTELPVRFSPLARFSGIAFGAAGVLAGIYGAWEHSGWLIGGGGVAFAAGFFVHGWARRLARLRRERIVGEPVS